MWVILRESNGEKKNSRCSFRKLWIVQLDRDKVHRWEKSRKYRPRGTMAKKTQFLPLCLTSILESQCGVVGPLVRKTPTFGKHIGVFKAKGRDIIFKQRQNYMLKFKKRGACCNEGWYFR